MSLLTYWHSFFSSLWCVCTSVFLYIFTFLCLCICICFCVKLRSPGLGQISGRSVRSSGHFTASNKLELATKSTRKHMTHVWFFGFTATMLHTYIDPHPHVPVCIFKKHSYLMGFMMNCIFLPFPVPVPSRACQRSRQIVNIDNSAIYNLLLLLQIELLISNWAPNFGWDHIVIGMCL